MNMTGAVKGFASNPAFLELLARFSDSPILGIISGLVLTVIVQSSSATVAMLQSLSATGALDFSAVYPIIMGINIGTCVVTAFYCFVGSSSRDSKRTGIVHVVFNTIGTVIFMIAMTIMQHLAVFGSGFWMQPVDSFVIAVFQSVFNIITAILLLPFTNLLVKISMLIVKEEPPKPLIHPELHTLNENLYISPAVAVNEVTKAVAAMGAIASNNFARGCDLLVNYDAAMVPIVNTDEDCLDQFADRADNFLIGLSKVVESEHDNRQMDMLLQAVPDFERIGDYATNLVELGERLKSQGAEFSEIAKRELALITGAVNEILSITVSAFESDDIEKAKAIEPLEETIDDMVVILRDRHTKRLKSGNCTVDTGLVFVEALTYLERASDQCSSIAVMMMARNNEKILMNHYDYLREIHSGNDAAYNAEKDRRREQYITPLIAIQ